MDTASKRFSAVNVQAPWRGIGIFPSGTVDQPARYALAHLYSGFQPGDDVDLTIGDGAVTIGGGSVAEKIGLAIGGGAVTLAGQAGQTTRINFGIGGGSVGIAGQTVDLLAELDVALSLETGQVTIAGQTIGLAVLDAQSSGGWEFLFPYERELKRRREEARKRAELEEETEQIPDEVDRSIAQLLREQEAIDAKRSDLKRLADLARQNADLEAARRYSERVAKALEAALNTESVKALARLEKELRKAREEEESLLLSMLLLLDE